MSGTTILDSYGQIDPIYIYKRNERTNTPFPEDYYNQYARQVLKNPYQEAPLFEYEINRKFNQSTDMLNIRETGRRTDKEPWLPDGTFLDFDAFAPDPRSMMQDPDYTLFITSSRARARNYTKKLDTDANQLMIDGCIHPAQMEYRKHSTIPRYKNAFRNFSTAYAGWASGSGLKQYKQSNAMKHGSVPSSIGSHLQDNVAGTRRYDATTQLSMTQLGWNSTTDHRFPVSSYSMVRPEMAYGANVPERNQRSTFVEYEVPVAIENENMPQNIKETMVSRINRRRNEIKELAKLIPKEMAVDIEPKHTGTRKDIHPIRFYSATGVRTAEPFTAEVKNRVIHSKIKTVDDSVITGLPNGGSLNSIHSVGSIKKRRGGQIHDINSIVNDVV